MKTLSDKSFNTEDKDFDNLYTEKDVKEFIKAVKDWFYAGNIHKVIDKLAGEKLI